MLQITLFGSNLQDKKLVITNIMSKNPFLNACAAFIYIAVVAGVMYYGPHLVGTPEDTGIMPVVFIASFLSLYAFSAAVMGYIFLYRPATLYIDGDKKGAVALFLKTLAFFGGLVLFVLLAFLFVNQ